MFNRDKAIDEISLGLKLSTDNEDIVALTDEQLEYIQHDINIGSFLKACPGSGKTEVTAIKTAFEINRWSRTASGMAVLSFTRSASKELEDRIDRFLRAPLPFPHFVGTFDSWLHNYIIHPFSSLYTGWVGQLGDKSLRIVSDDTSGYFLDNYKTDLYDTSSAFIVSAAINKYYLAFDINNSLKPMPESSDIFLKTRLGSLTKEQRVALIKSKQGFFKAGFATYQDCEFIAVSILQANPAIANLISSRFKTIIIDECQDLSYAQLMLLDVLSNNGSSIHLIGDLDQAIYEFRKVVPDNTKKFVDYKTLKTYQLTHNFRSNQKIVDLCQKIIGSTERIVGKEAVIHSNNCLWWEYDPSSINNLPNAFEKFLQKNNLSLERGVILARGRALLKEMRSMSTESPKSPAELLAHATDLFTSPTKKKSDLDSALSFAGKAMCYLAFDGKGKHTLHHCPEQITRPSEWRIFLFTLLNRLSGIKPNPSRGKRVTWSEWAELLRKTLEPFCGESHIVELEYDSFKKKIRAPSKKANKTLPDIFHTSVTGNKLKMTTIHDVKGATYETVLLVSSSTKKSEGGHFDHWVVSSALNDEARRFAYVACSRAKHIVVIATPKLSEESLRVVTEMNLHGEDHKSYLK